MMFLLFQTGMLLFFDATELNWPQWLNAGVAFLLVAIFLGFLLKAIPSWKDIKLAEITVREKEADARAAQATSFGQLSEALKSMSDVLNNVAVQQRDATERGNIQQRVSTDVARRTEEAVNQVAETLDGVIERIESIEQTLVGKE